MSTILFLGTLFILNSCTDSTKTAKEPAKKEATKIVYPSDVLPIFNEFNLILGDGSNAGVPNKLEDNKLWCSGAETHGGDVQKQYKDGNYAEIWFKTATISVNDASVSNKSYFTRND